MKPTSSRKWTADLPHFLKKYPNIINPSQTGRVGEARERQGAVGKEGMSKQTGLYNVLRTPLPTKPVIPIKTNAFFKLTD